YRRPAQRLHDDARKLSRAVRRAHVALSILAGSALSEHTSHESCDRFHGRLLWAVHLRSLRRSSAHAAPGVCPRSVYEVQNYLCEPGAACSEKSAKRVGVAVRRTSCSQAEDVQLSRQRE